MKIIDLFLEKINSTSDFAKEHKDEFEPLAMTCVIANEQTKGRGRFERVWFSPKDVNLYFTLYFQLPLNTLHLLSLGQLFAFSLISLLSEKGLDVRVKWPNDILLNGKKLSGILAEMTSSKDFVEIFLGMGINVNMEFDDAKKVNQPATSLKIETGKTWDKNLLLKEFQTEFLKNLELFQREGFHPFYKKLEEFLAFKGEKICCFDGKKRWYGICHSLREDGQLNLLLENGKMQTLFSGEIVLSQKG